MITSPTANSIVKHESTTQRGLFFWAMENTECPGAVTSFCVVGQAGRFPMTEAFDDWLATWEDANEIAQQLAKGEL